MSRCTVLAITCSAISGCMPTAAPVPPGPSIATTPGVAHSVPAELAWATAVPTKLVYSDTITLWLYAPLEAKAGVPVPMRLELENTRLDWIEVDLGGRAPHADFVVSDATGAERWSLHGDVVPLANNDPRRLDARERIVFPYEWKQESRSAARPGPRLPSGDYQLHARIRLRSRIVETPKRALRIRP